MFKSHLLTVSVVGNLRLFLISQNGERNDMRSARDNFFGTSAGITASASRDPWTKYGMLFACVDICTFASSL